MAGRRIAVTGGGTAGHIVAALEFLKAYRLEYGAVGFFIGCEGGQETRLVPERGERIEVVPGAPFARQTWGGKLDAVGQVARGVVAARRLLRRERIELVIGSGGYASLNTCMAAWAMGIPVVIHEANVEMGLANRILTKFADRVCLGFEETKAVMPSPKNIVTGSPPATKERGFGTTRAPVRFLVAGGSLGSRFLNRRAPELFARLARRSLQYTVHHLAGLGNRDLVAATYRDAGIEAHVEEFATDIANVYLSTDFAISAAGALTLADLAAAALPALLVPDSTAASGHQIANAKAYAARTMADWISETDWNTETQAEWIAGIVANPARIEAMRMAARHWSRPHAAREVVGVCEELVSRKLGRDTVEHAPLGY